MHVLSTIPASVIGLFLTWCLFPVAYAGTYFVIQEPAQGTQWTNNAANRVTWTKGLLDGVDVVDVEMSRLSQDGLIFVARDVPSNLHALNIFIQDVPPADDYFLLFINSTHGVMYASSPQFAIVNSGASNATASSPDPTVPTVTVSGSPNPTQVFATTFPPSANGAMLPTWQLIQGSGMQMFALMSTLLICLFGGAWTVL
ncbi:hypothetical protein C8Q75DRAFT_805976 [Abortiporus biennis]|nr:hypothetical protein C8Q75DRAFT_805976 [Abortiporus biennis]